MYKVNVGGENFIIHLEGKKRRINLLKAYYLNVPRQDLAEHQALGEFKKELESKVLNEIDDPPEMYIQSVESLACLPEKATTEIYWKEVEIIDAD